MRVPVSWLRALLPDLTASVDEVAAALLRVGLEVERVERVGHDVSGVVVGRVVDVEELAGFKKPIRFCHVDVGDAVREVVCGATNFAAGDRVCFALPGAVLPGGFTIATRETYGHTSDGMICSTAELGLPGDPSGILVLPADSPLGTDVVELLQLRDEVLDIAVTPDRGYQLSMRGVAREAATAFGLPFRDLGLLEVPVAGEDGWPVTLEDQGCSRFVASVVTGLDATAPSPLWLQRRLALAGMRSISLAVDVTNHVMLELGQPLHAYDLHALKGEVVVRRALPDERLATLDGADRALDPADLVIADDSGVIGLAGVMGGASTEVSRATTDVLIEAAHFDAVSIAKAARRHKLPSEASRRFERGVDPALCAVAAETAARLLTSLGGAAPGPVTDIDSRSVPAPIAFSPSHPGRVAGRAYEPEIVQRRLTEVGCSLAGSGEVWAVTPPSWRPDLLAPIDLVEEVIRLEGYETVPAVLPTAPAGRGLTDQQRWRRTASRALATAGLIEVTTPPFVAADLLAKAGGAPPSPRLVNPLSEEQALLRPLLLPSLLATAGRNVARGLVDVAVFEIGQVFQGEGRAVGAPPAGQRPSEAELAELAAALPHQPRHAALVLAGSRSGRPVDWGDAVEAVVAVGTALGLDLTLQRSAVTQAFHPGRCAALMLDGRMAGLAGEIHPRVVEALGLPARTVGAEFGLDGLVAAAAERGPVPAPVVSPFPPSSVDVALVVTDAVPAVDVETALREGAGPLLEVLRLFDVYSGPQVGDGNRSLAYTLRFRAPDRTLTDQEVMPARDAAVALAGERTGAVLRS